ncbi:MAG: alginate lyase family protein [Vicinamibacterales bacterium]
MVLARALVAVRLGDSEFTTGLRDEVVALLEQVIGSENGASALYVGRNLATYVIAADIIDLPTTRPDFDEFVFKPWLRSLARKEFRDRTLRSCHEDRPNNWGTHCGASRIAAAAYLNDRAEIARAASVFQGWLGDRQSYARFKFDPTASTWMSDPSCPTSDQDCHPRPINPAGATLRGYNVDGVIVDDQRRSERFRFRWPPKYTFYPYGALGGAVVQASILQRFGFDAWHWSEDAIRRAVEWMYDDRNGKDKWDTCDDADKRYVLDLVDHAYGSNFIGRMNCAPAPSGPGRNIAWTSWTHQRS